jgi:hypothetical protein
LSGSLDESRGTAERLSETSLQERVRHLEMELATLKRKGKASVACLEPFLYENRYQISTQSWTSGSLNLSVVLKDADEIGPGSCQANIWLAAISRLAQASERGVRPKIGRSECP